jgi:hypothetical protein
MASDDTWHHNVICLRACLCISTYPFLFLEQLTYFDNIRTERYGPVGYLNPLLFNISKISNKYMAENETVRWPCVCACARARVCVYDRAQIWYR